MMKKLFILCCLAKLLSAEPLAAIVASVNNEPITSLDVIVLSKNMNVSENEALKFLIQNKICVSLAKKFGLAVNPMEINEELTKIAASNNVSLDTFLDSYKDQVEILKTNIKEGLLKNKLFDLIAQNYSKDISEEEMLRFYNLNKDKMNNKSYELVKNQIKAHLMEVNAQEAIKTYMEKEEAKANIKMLR